MTSYRRNRVPGGCYFFTVNLADRRSDLLLRHIDALRDGVRQKRARTPFHIDAWVVLPEHMHLSITFTSIRCGTGWWPMSRHGRIRRFTAASPKACIRRQGGRRCRVGGGGERR